MRQSVAGGGAGRGGSRDSVRRGLETILSESERAARIVRNLLTFARKRQTTRAMVDVNQVMRETLALRSYEQRVSNITVIDALGRTKDLVICSAPEPGDRFPIVWVCDESAFDTADEDERRVPWPLDDLPANRVEVDA